MWGTKAYAWILTSAILGGLAWVFRSKGLHGILLILTFQAALVLTQLSVHWVVKHGGFPYTSFLTLLQFLVLQIILLLMMWRRNFRIMGADGVTCLSLWGRSFAIFYMYKVLPVALVMGLGVAINNASLGLIAPGLNAVLGSLTPACTGFLSALCGTRLPRRAWLALIIASCGGALTVKGGLDSVADVANSNAAVIGISFSFLATLLRALKTVLIQQAVRPNENFEQTDNQSSTIKFPVLQPFQLLVLQTPAITLFLLICTGFDADGLYAPMAILLRIWSLPNARMLAGALCVNIASANYLNFVGVKVVHMLGASAMQITGKCNIFIAMALSAAYTGETIALDVWFGSAIILMSAWLFTAATQTKRRLLLS